MISDDFHAKSVVAWALELVSASLWIVVPAHEISVAFNHTDSNHEKSRAEKLGC